MADKQDKTSPPDIHKNVMNAGMLGFAFPVPIPVLTPQVMPVRMMPPFWPTNSTSFMQQYMEAMSSGMTQTMNQSAAGQKESPIKAMSRKEDSLPGLAKAARPAGLENTNMNQFLTEFGKRQGVDFSQFSNPVVLPIRGLLPFGSYFPSLNVPVSSLPNKQSKYIEGPLTNEPLVKECECDNVVDKVDVSKGQLIFEGEGEQEELSRVKPDIQPPEVKLQEPCAKDISSGISEDNSPEMDVAQILVNFMPVPVIGNVKDGGKASSLSEASKTETVPVKDALTGNSSSVKTDFYFPKGVAAVKDMMMNGVPRPRKATPVKDCTPNCIAADAKDMVPTGVSIMKDSIPKESKESDKAQPVKIETEKDMAVQEYSKIQIPNGSVAVSANSNSKPVIQISNTVPSGVIILLNTQTPSHPQDHILSAITPSQPKKKCLSTGQLQTQDNHSNPVAFVKTEYRHDSQKEDESIENGSQLMELGPQLEESQQGVVSDDESSVPTVDDLLKGDLGSDKATYQCEVCAQLFRSSLGLQKHLEFHMDDGQHFTCTICFQPFNEAKTLDDHIAQHMRKRPHKCKFCPKAFRDPGSLQKHVRVHTGEKPYKCNSCEQSFAEYSSLRKHLRVHTGEQPYRCQYCDKAFSISGNLQRHVLIHTGERPYKCSFCPKAFNNPSHLRRHVKNLHFKGEVTTGVVEDMISALHGETKRTLPANEVEIETTQPNMEISQEEEDKVPFTPKAI